MFPTNTFEVQGQAVVGNARADVIGTGTSYPFPDVAAPVEVVSDDAADTEAGTGARVVRLTGLDANLHTVQEDVVLDGTTPVTTDTEFLRINGAEVIEVGSGGVNAGEIQVSDGDGDVYSTIPAGAGKSLDAVFTAPKVPKIHRIVSLYGAVLGGDAKSANFQIETRKPGEAWKVRSTVNAYGQSKSSEFKLLAPITLEPGEDAKISALASDATTSVIAAMNIVYGSSGPLV